MRSHPPSPGGPLAFAQVIRGAVLQADASGHAQRAEVKIAQARVW